MHWVKKTSIRALEPDFCYPSLTVIVSIVVIIILSDALLVSHSLGFHKLTAYYGGYTNDSYAVDEYGPDDYTGEDYYVDGYGYASWRIV